jgi:hypothetical protein
MMEALILGLILIVIGFYLLVVVLTAAIFFGIFALISLPIWGSAVLVLGLVSYLSLHRGVEVLFSSNTIEKIIKFQFDGRKLTPILDESKVKSAIKRKSIVSDLGLAVIIAGLVIVCFYLKNAWWEESILALMGKVDEFRKYKVDRFLVKHSLVFPLICLVSGATNPKCNLILDATWFGRKYCLIVYWDPELEKAQWWRYSDKKEAASEIIADLELLKGKGVILASATSDGAPGIKTALKYLYPDIPHQRCLVHLQRMALIFLTQRPRIQAGRELRSLASQLNQITTHNQRYLWRKNFCQWCRSGAILRIENIGGTRTDR